MGEIDSHASAEGEQVEAGDDDKVPPPVAGLKILTDAEEEDERGVRAEVRSMFFFRCSSSHSDNVDFKLEPPIAKISLSCKTTEA